MKWDIYIYNKSGIPLVIDCTQGSNAYEWEFRVRDYALLPGATARIYFRKPSGAEIYNDCEVGGNVIKVDVTTQMTAEAGKIPAQFQIVPDPGKPDHVKPFVFWINVQKSLSMNSQIESTDEFTVLDNLIAEARNTIDMAEAATDKADLAAQEANTAKGQAETAAQAANTAAGAANAAAQAANTAAGAANSAAGTANTAAQGANAAKSQAETAAQAANEAAEAANEAAAGNISNKVVTFQQAAERANIQSGDTLAEAFGKLAKFCADFGGAAFAGIANNLTTTMPGSVLDAQQGKVLNDEINELNTKINNLRSWYDEYYVKKGYGARVKYKDGSTPMPDGVYLVDAVITETSMDTYTRYLVRIRQPAGIYKITRLQTVSSPDELQVNLYWGGESTDQLSIMTNNDTQYYTVTLGITQIA